MKIEVSDTIGFCYGVRNAVRLSERTVSGKAKDIFSAGPIIHNPQVVKRLFEKGLRPVADIESIKKGTVVISSHGYGAHLAGRGLKIVDATCPFVKMIRGYVKTLHGGGYKVVIVGGRAHPEVKALAAFTGGKAVIVKDAEGARRLDLGRAKVGVVSQSTYSEKAFREIVSILSQKDFTELRIYKTICRDTIKRQDDIRGLAGKADAVIVVGGKNSANTRRLVEVCRDAGMAAHHIERSGQVKASWVRGKKCVGIASGASTPDWVVREVINEVRRYCKKC